MQEKDEQTSEQPVGPSGVSPIGDGRPEKFFASLVDRLPICVLCKDLEGRITYANTRFLQLMELSIDQVLGKTDFDLFPADLAEKYRNDDRKVIQSDGVFECIERNQHDGREVYFEVRKMPMRNAAGNVVGVEALFWDVTRRYRAELALEEEKYLLHQLMEHLPDSIYFKDRESRFVRTSRGQAVKFGFQSSEEVYGKTDADIFSEEHAQAARQDELQIIETGEPILNKVERETWDDGEDTYCSTTKLPWRDKEGNIIGTFGISRDVTELKRIEEALRRTKDEAEIANRAKSDFLANMSHEIRTPMNAIIGISELLLNANPTDSQREYLAMVLSSAESLMSIINDILDFAKIEAGKFALERRVFDVRNGLGDTIKSHGIRAHAKNLELVFYVAPDVPELAVGDLGRLRQVLINLLGNAVKFTETGEIVVEVSRLPDDGEEGVRLAVSVRDTGIGIPQDKLESIFGEFEQVDSSTTRTYGGTGLGLAITSRLVGLMGGKIGVTSRPGYGSCFTFSVRLGLPLGEEFQVRLDAPHTLDDLRVLIVDDNETNRRILVEMVLNWGMQPHSVASAQAAIEQLRSAATAGHPISIVLSDFNMPQHDGLQLAQWIRDDPELADTHVIMLTSSTGISDSERLADLGVQLRLTKPVKQSEVFNAIQSTLQLEHVMPEAGLKDAPAAPTAAAALKVLLAEDNRVNQKLAMGILSQQGHEVVVANDGGEAVQLFETGDFDVILMDVQMPVLDGLDATRHIRQLEEGSGRHVPIIALTARAMREDEQKCLDAGMDDYLSKPIRQQQLAEKLAPLIEARGA